MRGILKHELKVHLRVNKESTVSLSDKDVKHVAKLSSIYIEDQEVETVKAQLNSILEYVDRLSEIPTRGVTPTYHVHGINNAFREDVLETSLNQDVIKENAPDFSGGFFRVPSIIKSGNS